MSGTGGGRILVVDDTRLNRSVLVRALEEQGHQALEAADGRAALELLAIADGGTVDVVLLDLEMPELDGYEVLRRMKADEALRHIPVIVISAVDELDSVVRCIEMGAADYLPKPFDASILRARLSASLASKRLHDLELDYAARQATLLETIERQRTELARFLSPQVAALVSSPEGQDLLDGHRRLITAVFSDLRGFTAFSETAEPEELFGVLREYQAAMGELILANGGTLEHFAGDGMLVFFNDPVPVADHEARAVRLAVAMRERFEALRGPWRKRGYELGFGVGVAVGHATLGRIGFEGRYDYGAIGMVVILASRLAAEAHDGQILLSQRAYAAVEDLVVGEPVGELSLKGFTRPVPAHNVLALRGDAAGAGPAASAPGSAAPAAAEA
ncbi:MAG TPA: response regulator [Candidatus Dormibacteraeota bacterium]|nr:response regulator [Candidatus Dormibacteraeota bacterium]